MQKSDGAKAKKKEKKEQASGQSGAQTPAAEPDATAEEPAEQPAEEPAQEPTTVDSARGADSTTRARADPQGDFAGAVPVLQEAVASWPQDSRELTYAYALFNLGQALNRSGRAAEAIPYLEKRLTWDDQVDRVQASSTPRAATPARADQSSATRIRSRMRGTALAAASRSPWVSRMR